MTTVNMRPKFFWRKAGLSNPGVCFTMAIVNPGGGIWRTWLSQQGVHLRSCIINSKTSVSTCSPPAIYFKSLC